MATILSRSPHVNVTHDTYTTTTIPVCKIRPIFPETYGNLPRLVKNLWKFVLSCKNYLGWVGLSGFLWWAPSAKRKDHHGVSFAWSSVWHRSNTGLSSTQYEQIPIILGVWPFWLLFSVNNILVGLWLNCISFVEITLFLLADILQHRALFQC